MKNQPPHALDSDEVEGEAEELEEAPEEDEEEPEELPQQPPRPPTLPHAPHAEPSLPPISGPNLNRNLLDLVSKRLEMQADLLQQMMDRQERMYSEHQQDRQALHELIRDLGILSEMTQESLGTMDSHKERLSDAVAALIRLHQESHPASGQ